MKRLALVLLLTCASAHAGHSSLNVVPSGWTVESYGPQGVVLWNTGSTCQGGILTLPEGSELSIHNRLFALVTSAKLANAKVFVNYDDATPYCTISSFGLD